MQPRLRRLGPISDAEYFRALELEKYNVEARRLLAIVEGRIYNIFDVLEEHRQRVLLNDPDKMSLIAHAIRNSDKNDDITNAALVLSEFISNLYSNKLTEITNNDFHALLVNAIENKNLSVKYANNLYLVCRKGTQFIQEPNEGRYTVCRWLAPDLKSKQWQETVEKIRGIVLEKLENELLPLNVFDRIELLEKAKDMPIFNENMSNIRFIGACTKPQVHTHITMHLKHLKETRNVNIARSLTT